MNPERRNERGRKCNESNRTDHTKHPQGSVVLSELANHIATRIELFCRQCCQPWGKNFRRRQLTRIDYVIVRFELFISLQNKMNSPITKRKVVKRLDFENCVITTVKMKKKFRKRLKAKITNEYAECLSESSDQSQNNSSPIHLDINEKSPILFRRCCSRKRANDIPSPILITKSSGKKRDARERCKKLKSENQSSPSTSSCAAAVDSSSPVFVFKRKMKKQTPKMGSEQTDVSGSRFGAVIEESPDPKRLTQIQLFSSPTSRPEVLIDDDDKDVMRDCKCNIEEFTPQELSKELKILSFSSGSKAISDIMLEEQSRQENDEPFFRTPEKGESEAEEPALDSGRKRKRHKKGGLVAKLVNLRQRHASERRIREHTRKIMKAEETWKKTLQVTECWIDGSKLLLKCQEVTMAQEVTKVSMGNVFMLLDKDLGNCFWKIKKGTLLRIAPPWQELGVLRVNVILNISSVELIDEVPEFLEPKIKMRKISMLRYKEDEASLINSLLDLEHNVYFNNMFT